MSGTKAQLKIEGMHCEACVRRVTVSLAKLPGVEVERVVIGDATVAFDPSRVQVDAMIAAIDAIGFHAEAVA